MKAKDNEVKIYKEMPKCVAEDLIKMRLFRHEFQIMSRRQYVDLNNKMVYKVIENEQESDGAMPFNYAEVKIGGYSIEALTKGYEKAKVANDAEAAKTLEKLVRMYYDRLRSIRPVITVKKVLGWNAGYVMDKPWFSTCWEDKKGRIMMDVLFSVERLEGASNNDIDRVCEDNNIYLKLRNFVSVRPYEDRINYTYYIDRYVEGEGREFYRAVVMLRESADSPVVCQAEFYSIDCLNKFNETTHVVSKETYHRIKEKRRLDNNALKKIAVEDVKLLYYNQSQMSREFGVLVKKGKKDGEMVSFGKNIIVKRVDYVWYTGTYGTSDLLPDNLNAKFGMVLDDEKFRKTYGNENTTFAMDDLSGMARINGWASFNNQIEHLMVESEFYDAMMDRLDKRIILPEKMMKSNVQSDLKECWRKVIEKHYEIPEGSLKAKRVKEFPAVKPEKVVAFSFATSEAREWPGMVELVMEKSPGKVSAVAVECMGQRNKANLEKLKKMFPFLDAEMVRDFRKEQNKNLKEDKKWLSAFDMVRGGYDVAMPEADFRWFDMGFGNHLFVAGKHIRDMFNGENVRQAIKEKKLEQMSVRNRQELYNLVLAQWVRFFDEMV